MLVPNRVALADVCNERGLIRAVEIGTDRGIFAREFLDRWKGEMMICVDPYTPYAEMPFDRMPDLLMAVAMLTPHIPRCKIVRAPSEQAPGAMCTYWQKADFVYIDGAHDYASVATDIRVWWPYVSDGGIMSGHDYNAWPGVTRAVDEFAAREGLTVRVTGDFPRSWWVDKP